MKGHKRPTQSLADTATKRVKLCNAVHKSLDYSAEGSTDQVRWRQSAPSLAEVLVQYQVMTPAMCNVT